MTEELDTARGELKEHTKERESYLLERSQLKDRAEMLEVNRDELEQGLTRLRTDTKRHDKNSQT